MAEPHPKSAQLARGPKRPGRIKATPQEWVKIRQAKLGTCRCYGHAQCQGRAELHHIVPRAHGGDDLEDNLAPLCTEHHRTITSPEVAAVFGASLTDSEYAYLIGKLGEGGLERLYGIEYAP